MPDTQRAFPSSLMLPRRAIFACDNRLVISLTAALVLIGFALPSVHATEFTPARIYPVGPHPLSIALGDFNLDGHIDIAAGNEATANVSIRLNNGDGSFRRVDPSPVGFRVSAIAAADFTSDGRLDLVVSSGPSAGTGGASALLRGRGDGTFDPPRGVVTDPFFSDGATTLIAADFDRDGNLDLAASDSGFEVGGGGGSGGGNVLYGRGDGTFDPLTKPGPFVGQWFVVADFNGDGSPDIADGGSNSAGLRVALNTGDRTFQSSSFYDEISFARMTAGDFNGDGLADIVFLGGSVFGLGSGHGVLIGHGDGRFEWEPVTQPVVRHWGTQSLAAADFDGDGHLDLAALVSSTPQSHGTLAIMTGNGDGTFRDPTDLGVSDSPTAVASADFNADGLPDLATTDLDSGVVNVLLNRTLRINEVVSVTKEGRPLRIKILGVNFSPRAHVLIGNTTTPWPGVRFRSEGLLALKRQPPLEEAFPIGVPVRIRVATPDGRAVETVFTRE
jgi:hypothetical protein